MSSQHQVVFCTCPDKTVATSIANHIVNEKMAACVNILPGLTSVYRWQKQIESAEEVLLIIKSRQDRFPTLKAAILELHPYDVPEIIAIPIHQGLPEYLQWIDTCVT